MIEHALRGFGRDAKENPGSFGWPGFFYFAPPTAIRRRSQFWPRSHAKKRVGEPQQAPTPVLQQRRCGPMRRASPIDQQGCSGCSGKSAVLVAECLGAAARGDRARKNSRAAPTPF
jgi:hypothetical protein